MGGSLVAPVIIFFEWVCSGGFQIGGATNDHRWVCSSLIVDRRAGFGGWIGWVDRWVDRFETVDLLIGGWIIGSSGDDIF